MIRLDQIDQVMDADVVGADGEKIGSVDTVFVDDETNEPEFLLVNTGLFGLRSSFVPLREARLEADAVRVPYSKDRVKDAPNIGPDDALTPDEEMQLLDYYGVAPAGAQGTAGTGQAAPPRDMAGPRDAVGRDTSGPTTDDAMTRSEEELRIGTERRVTGRARLRKHIVTEHVTKTVPVQREEVHIEREPITDANVDDAMSGPELSEEEHEMTLTEEEPVVEKRTVPKERVRLDKDVRTGERQVDEDVRREEIDMDDDTRH